MNNKSLTQSQYKEYLKKIKDLEVTCYQLRELDERLQQQKSQLQQKNYNLLLPPVPQKASFFNYIAQIICTILRIIIYAFIGDIISLIIWTIFSGDGFLDNLIGGKGSVSSDPYIIVGLLSGAIIALIIGIFNLLTMNIGFSADMEQYEKSKKEIESNKIHNIQILNNIDLALKNCKNELIETNNVLKQYYDLGYIYPKYRGLIPVCTIYEYLDSGRCFRLEGHEGAYNLYENELRMNIILNKLNEIIYRLDDISSSQHLLANEIKSSNIQINNLCNSLENIESNAELTQYYSKLSAANTAYLKWINFLKH